MAPAAVSTQQPSCTEAGAPATRVKRPLYAPITVTDWVTVHIDKRRVINRNMAAVPAIVSRVDEEKGTVNVLFPNRLSVFFHRYSPANRIVFAIETYPLSKVFKYQGPVQTLEPLLQQALARFAELREAARRREAEAAAAAAEEAAEAVADAGAEAVAEAGADELPSASAAAESSQLEAPAAEDTKATEEVEAPSEPTALVEQPGVAEESEEVAAPATPLTPQRMRLRPIKEVAAATLNEASSPVKVSVKASVKSDIRGFTRDLSQLLNSVTLGSLSKAHIQKKLGGQYPEWDEMLNQLDEMNKVLVAQDVVFRI